MTALSADFQPSLFDEPQDETQVVPLRTPSGTLLCFCGKAQQFYSGLFETGFCSEACWQAAFITRELLQ